MARNEAGDKQRCHSFCIPGRCHETHNQSERRFAHDSFATLSDILSTYLYMPLPSSSDEAESNETIRKMIPEEQELLDKFLEMDDSSLELFLARSKNGPDAMHEMMGRSFRDNEENGLRCLSELPTETIDAELAQALSIKERAVKSNGIKDYLTSIVHYKDAIRVLVPCGQLGDLKPPLFLPSSSDKQAQNGTADSRYTDVAYWRRLFLMGCCTQLAHCYLKHSNDSEARLAS